MSTWSGGEHGKEVVMRLMSHSDSQSDSGWVKRRYRADCPVVCATSRAHLLVPTQCATHPELDSVGRVDDAQWAILGFAGD